MTRAALILGCGLFWLAVLVALTGCDADAALPQITLPPERYRGDAAVTVDFTGEAKARCPATAQAPFCLLGGVVMLAPNPCDYPDDRYARGLCHELGHANKWPGDHPAT